LFPQRDVGEALSVEVRTDERKGAIRILVRYVDGNAIVFRKPAATATAMTWAGGETAY
jgi:hypothetical protein